MYANSGQPAVAVALELVSFSLGTDTAGSGRVPAAFNNLVGLKPTRGALSTRGVLPACRSLDCVSIFSRRCDEVLRLFDLCQALILRMITLGIFATASGRGRSLVLA